MYIIVIVIVKCNSFFTQKECLVLNFAITAKKYERMNEKFAIFEELNVKVNVPKNMNVYMPCCSSCPNQKIKLSQISEDDIN